MSLQVTIINYIQMGTLAAYFLQCKNAITNYYHIDKSIDSKCCHINVTRQAIVNTCYLLLIFRNTGPLVNL